jgi:hypothetical protein
MGDCALSLHQHYSTLSSDGASTRLSAAVNHMQLLVEEPAYMLLSAAERYFFGRLLFWCRFYALMIRKHRWQTLPKKETLQHSIPVTAWKTAEVLIVAS